MKYGIVVYKNTDNIGDDILTYAAECFLPQVDYVIDRENMDTFFDSGEEPVKVILNGWLLHNKLNWPPSPVIKPLIIGAHFTPNRYWGITNQHLSCGDGRDYIQRLARKYPIGCRDMNTMKMFESMGVPAYFSGCLSLTLSKMEGVVPSGKIVLVDVDSELEKFVIGKYGAENVELLSHWVTGNDRNGCWSDRRTIVKNRLKIYQAAK